MDTTEAYIKMCEKADEIQSIAEIPTHDSGFFWCKAHDILMDYCDGGYLFCKMASCRSDKYTWLPRQDQLQNMVIFPDHPYYQIGRFNVTIDEWCDKNYLASGASMEQLWLAFVMKEKYNKVWNGEEWIKAS